MTRKEAERLPLGAPVLIGGEQRARLYVADAKWTADMRGMAVVQRRNARDEVPSGAPNRGWLLVSRRQLSAAS